MGKYRLCLSERAAIAALGEKEYFIGPVRHEASIYASVPTDCGCANLNRFLGLIARRYGWSCADFEFIKIDPDLGAILEVFEYEHKIDKEEKMR